MSLPNSTQDAAAPEHLIALPHGWAAWRWVVLRSAGFPAEEVLRFSAPDASRAIDHLLELEAAVDHARAQAIESCLRLLERTPEHQHRPIRKLIDRLRAGQVPSAAEPTTGAIVAALLDAEANRAAHRRVVEDVFGQDSRRIGDAIRALAQGPRFREAIAWQNRVVLGNTLDSLLETPSGAADSRTRQKEATVAGYAQRYCVKNDTIGFFGPVGWAQLSDREIVADVRPGDTLLDARNVHFEYWCIDALAAKLAEDRELRLDLAPRRMPTVRLEDGLLHYPVARSAPIEPAYLALLAACDGSRSARELARALCESPELAISTEDVYGMLDELAERRLVRWTLEIPTAGQHPERHLSQLLAALPASAARDRALGQVAQLEAGRAAVARAAGDPAALEAALREFDQRFSALTGLAATRRPGQTYAARTLIYEDTRRNVRVELGRGFVDRLGPPLALILLSARWYTHAIAAAYRPVLGRAYHELRQATGDGRVDYLLYLERVLPDFAAQSTLAPTVAPIRDELHARWMRLLGVTEAPRQLERSAAQLLPEVKAAFAAPGPGWPQARYHSPDVMAAAADLDALRRGELTCVLGEIHVGAHTYTRPVFLNLHPDPEALLRARRHDLGRPMVATVETRANALRSDHFPPSPEDLDIETTDARSWRAASQVIPVAQLVVEADGETLRVRTRDGRRAFDLFEVLEGYLQLASSTHFTVLPRLAHVPRVTIDGLVVHRESWTFAPADLAFARASGLDRFVAARQWAQRHGLPRFAFVRVPQEPKPCFVDLESPIYVEILARLVRQAQTVTLSEMLPAIDQTWLVDAEGKRFTAELRMAMVDPEPWRAG